MEANGGGCLQAPTFVCRPVDSEKGKSEMVSSAGEEFRLLKLVKNMQSSLKAHAPASWPPTFFPYGTAGFRARAEELRHVMHRCGLLCVLNALTAMSSSEFSKETQQTTTNEAASGFWHKKTATDDTSTAAPKEEEQQTEEMQKRPCSVVGAIITASHNPVCDNGIKMVNRNGNLLNSAWEQHAVDLINAAYETEGECVPTLRQHQQQHQLPPVLSGEATTSRAPAELDDIEGLETPDSGEENSAARWNSQTKEEEHKEERAACRQEEDVYTERRAREEGNKRNQEKTATKKKGERVEKEMEEELRSEEAGFLTWESDQVIQRLVAKATASQVNLLNAPCQRVCVAVGRDTRPSSKYLSDAFASGVKALGAEVVDFGVLTTPQFHYLVETVNSRAMDLQEVSQSIYIQDFSRKAEDLLAAARKCGMLPPMVVKMEMEKKSSPQREDVFCGSRSSSFTSSCTALQKPVEDCLLFDGANGVGGQKAHLFAPLLERLLGVSLKVFNSGGSSSSNDSTSSLELSGGGSAMGLPEKPTTGILNLNCGAEHVQKTKSLPENFGPAFKQPGMCRCCSVDGDADRLVYFTWTIIDDNQTLQFHLLDGDRIAALYCKCFLAILERCCRLGLLCNSNAQPKNVKPLLLGDVSLESPANKEETNKYEEKQQSPQTTKRVVDEAEKKMYQEENLSHQQLTAHESATQGRKQQGRAEASSPQHPILRIGFIQTAYANGGSTKFLKQCIADLMMGGSTTTKAAATSKRRGVVKKDEKTTETEEEEGAKQKGEEDQKKNNKKGQLMTSLVSVEVACVKTGVKFLHSKAMEYDVAIYFEANGHGTVYSRIQNVQKWGQANGIAESAVFDCLIRFLRLFNHTTGDALVDMMAVEISLRMLGMSLDDWLGLYTEYPCQQLKVPMERKMLQQLKPNPTDEKTLVEPVPLQEAIDAVVERMRRENPSADTSNSLRSFIRPSGTENVCRIYAEAPKDGICTELANAVFETVSAYANAPNQQSQHSEAGCC